MQAYLSMASRRGLIFVGSNLAALIKRGAYPLFRGLKENIPSQLLPLKPEGHEHLYDLPSSSQDPPFLQGLGIHLLITDEITLRKKFHKYDTILTESERIKRSSETYSTDRELEAGKLLFLFVRLFLPVLPLRLRLGNFPPTPPLANILP